MTIGKLGKLELISTNLRSTDNNLFFHPLSLFSNTTIEITFRAGQIGFLGPAIAPGPTFVAVEMSYFQDKCTYATARRNHHFQDRLLMCAGPVNGPVFLCSPVLQTDFQDRFTLWARFCICRASALLCPVLKKTLVSLKMISLVVKPFLIQFRKPSLQPN